jgi:hypothetical protein
LTEESLFEVMDQAVGPAGASSEPGEEYVRPALDVRRYYRRPVRWNGVPILGRALSVVAVVRQPMELSFSDPGYKDLLVRASMAAGGRFSFWKGAVIGLTVVVLTSEPIGPGDDAILGQALGHSLRRYRAVPFGLIRINLGQEAFAFALRESPERLFSEAHTLADRLSESLRRFVPLLEL